jgi:hypothetical protein
MFVVGMNVHNPSEYTFINLILLKVDDKYPADWLGIGLGNLMFNATFNNISVTS